MQNFTRSQLAEIEIGKEQDLDVTIYASPVFDWEQMNLIRQGLLLGLPVEYYACPKLSYARMHDKYLELREELYEAN